MNTLLKSFSAQQIAVERATGDSVIVSSLSAQQISVEHATGSNALSLSFSATKAGYDINGTEIVVPNIRTYITRVK